MADVYVCGGNNLVGVYGGYIWKYRKDMVDVSGSGGSIWWVWTAVICVWCEWAAAA
jgi:hypothetical protein